ncbi:hypothetical protein DQ04_02611060 [Trypanosoma grayi]|uniref:hypothetical protein n=1 Tax=Trypanosoma grayi TaxID=71804 RepID=UPI0004F49C90|nr:hypothetical protein DQ04_02611060 [Trypanosoma grayi]KEG11447.1 hypothetical protein DQ04_02611060 [Trypanosoma grayi]
MEFATQLEGENMHVSLVKIDDREEHVYGTAVSPDGKYLAAVLGDGSLFIMDPRTLHVLQRSAAGKSYDDLPSTAVRWLAKEEGCVYDLVSVSSGGGVFVWRWDGDIIERIVRVHEKDNEITCLAVSPDGDAFLTAGSDRNVRCYGANGTLRGIMNRRFDEDGFVQSAHTNRILSVRFVTPTLAVSGGWGSPIQVWDMRNLESRKCLVGTQIAADGIEPVLDTSCIVVTSKRADQQLQVFDCVSGSEIEDDSMRLSSAVENHVPLLTRYCKKTGCLWTITTKPHSILVTSFTSGELLASFASPFPLMNVEVSDHFPRKAFVSCSKGKLFVATVKP